MFKGLARPPDRLAVQPYRGAQATVPILARDEARSVESSRVKSPCAARRKVVEIERIALDVVSCGHVFQDDDLASDCLETSGGWNELEPRVQEIGGWSRCPPFRCLTEHGLRLNWKLFGWRGMRLNVGEADGYPRTVPLFENVRPQSRSGLAQR